MSEEKNYPLATSLTNAEQDEAFQGTHSTSAYYLLEGTALEGTISFNENPSVAEGSYDIVEDEEFNISSDTSLSFLALSALNPLWKSFVSSFIKTLLKEFFIPMLREKTYLRHFKEETIEQICFTIVDAYLYYLSNNPTTLTIYAITQIPKFILSQLKNLGILDATKIPSYQTIVFSIENAILGYLTSEESLKHLYISTNLATSGAIAGPITARGLMSFFSKKSSNHNEKEPDLRHDDDAFSHIYY